MSQIFRRERIAAKMDSFDEGVDRCDARAWFVAGYGGVIADSHRRGAGSVAQPTAELFDHVKLGDHLDGSLRPSRRGRNPSPKYSLRAMISLVIPLLNERDSLRPLVEQIEAVFRPGAEPWEVIFVDDGSTDGSTEVLRDLVSRHAEIKAVKLRRNFGKSAALMAGLRAARGERVVTLDSDLQDDPAEIPKVLKRLDDGLDVVSGWKRKRHDPISKRWPSKLFNQVTARLSGVRLHDFNCGLKAYRSGAAHAITLYGELHRYIPVIAAYRGFRVGEVEVAHRPRSYGESKFGSERYLRGMFDLLTVLFIGRYQHRPLHLFGGFGITMMGVGMLIAVYLTVLKATGEAIGSRPLLLLGVLLIVVGMQFLSLGLISEMIASYRADDDGRRARDYQVKEILLPDGGSSDRLASGDRAEASIGGRT